MKTAIAYVKSEILDKKNPELRSYQDQESSILNYCTENNIDLVRIFRDANELYDPLDVLSQIVLYLSRDTYDTKFLVVNSFVDLKNGFDNFSNSVDFYWNYHRVKVICLYEKFVKKIIDGVEEYPYGVVQKQMSECIIRFLLSFKSKTVKFTVHDLYVFGTVELPAISQYLRNMEIPANLDILFDLWEKRYPGTDYRKEYLSLIDSILELFISYDLVFLTDPEFDCFGESKVRDVIGGYKVLSSFVGPKEETEFLKKEFSIVFSDEFWNDFRSRT